MDSESISKKFFEELFKLGNELNLPPEEITRMTTQYMDIAERIDNPEILTRLGDDLISSVMYRANEGIPDNIPDDMIVENIAQQETTNKTFEVSTKGDDLGKQFSALNATFKEGPYKGRTIEDVWQNEIKKSGKGKPPAENSILFGKDYQVSKDEYQKLWQRWADENPELINQLKAKVDEGYNLVDSFAGDPNKTVNQAEALTNVLNNQKGAADNFPLTKIISGLQKNVDQYGIEAAKALGLDYGGTVNRGFKVVPDGSNSPNFEEFKASGNWEEIDSQYYPDRTKANAQNGDGTVWFGEGDSRGYGATKREVGVKPWIENPTSIELREWIIDNNIKTLNVAGNRSYGTEELGEKAKNTIINAVENTRPQGGSVGAARRNDPNIFDEKIPEYDPEIDKEFKTRILDKMDETELKLLEWFNNHDAVKTAQTNGESVLLGLVKAFGYDVFEKYNSLHKHDPRKLGGKAVGKLFKAFVLFADPIGEGIEKAVRIGVRSKVIKDSVSNRHMLGDNVFKALNEGRKVSKAAVPVGKFTARAGGVATNWYYELKNQVIWQSAAAVVSGIDNVADVLNSVLDEWGLLPEAIKEHIDVIPQEELKAHMQHQARYWQSAGWQGSKLTSLWYNLDTMLPSRVTGNTPVNWLVNDAIMGSQLPQRFEFDADEEAYWDIVTGQREFHLNAQDGFFGWWKNERDMTGQWAAEPSYFSQVNNPELNVHNANSHVDMYNKLEKLKNRFGPGIVDMAGYDLSMYNNMRNNTNEDG